jgi:hypothetical protein
MARNLSARSLLISVRHLEETMRITTLSLAVAAAIAAGSFAHAQTGPAMKEDTGSTVNTQGAPGLKQGQPTNPTGAASTPAPAAPATTGSSMRPGGTNNEQTGTQSHDAQKGGGGKDGAR